MVGQVDWDVPKQRRLKVVRCSAESLIGFYHKLNWDKVVKVEGLPSDAVVVGVACDMERRVFSILLESKEFPEVPDGAMPPDLRLFFTETYLAVLDG